MNRGARRGTGLVVMLAIGLATATPAAADVLLDLSGVDTGGVPYQRFLAWATPALTGPAPYGFEATDAATLYRLGAGDEWGELAAAMAEAQVAAAETAMAGALRPDIAFDSYLYAGPMLREVALTADWCGAFLTPAQHTRFAAYAEQALYNIWHPELASWGGTAWPWSGWSIDNPGNNYHFSFLMATMYWALAADSAPWQSFLTTDKLPPLVSYYQGLPGGGSREGTGYGVSLGNLFELYRLWRDSTGVDLAAQSSHLVDTVDYWLHATLPTRDRYAPVGDLARESYPNLYDYHRRLVLEAHASAGAALEADRATWWLGRISVDEMTSGFNLRYDLLPPGETAVAPTALYHHATGAGHLFARTGWGRWAAWLGFVAGPYVESHAHQDQGSFTLFKGDFLAVSENVFTHSGIQQGSEVHNVLRFVAGGVTVPQREGTTSSMTVTDSGDLLEVHADLSPAFAVDSGVTGWTRDLAFDATGLEVHDLYTVTAGVTAVFQVNVPVEPVMDGDAIVAGELRIVPLVPAAPTVTFLEWASLDAVEFRSGWKVELSGGGGEYLVRLEVPPVIFVDDFESGDTSVWVD